MPVDAHSTEHEQRKAAIATNVTSRPMLAIMGVLLGALISVFTGRLLSIGLADVQGAIGANSDDMSWVVTAFNAANMFIGPLSVFLGGLLGPRRVLLWASAIFAMSEFLSPLVAHNVGALLVLQFIAGLSAGTYYPLTLSVIINNLPMRLVHFGIAAYALDILASTHIATALEAWYMDHLSWHWVFWNALLVTPLMVACVYFGIPKQPIPQSKPTGHNFWGFLYAACAFTLIYIGLDQGERLDWLHSGVVVAFLVSGAWLLFVTVIRRIRHPHPLLNLKFITSRNFLLLGFILVCFRFLLLAPTLLIPKYLELVHGYRPDQTGNVLAWVSVIQLIAAPIAGWLLYRTDSRLLCSIGFLIVGATAMVSSKIDPGWTGETFVVSQAINAVGLTLALTGLVNSILRNAMALGALKSPANILTVACWFQTCRLFGAEIGKSVMLHFLRVQGTLHGTVLKQYFDGGWQTDERLRQLIALTIPDGSGLDDAKANAAKLLGAALEQQAGMLAVSDGLVLVAITAAICLAAMAALRYAPPLVPKSNP